MTKEKPDFTKKDFDEIQREEAGSPSGENGFWDDFADIINNKPLTEKIKIEDINVGLTGELSHAFLLVSDVKQALKRLKEEIWKDVLNTCYMNPKHDEEIKELINTRIDKIMGEDLTK